MKKLLFLFSLMAFCLAFLPAQADTGPPGSSDVCVSISVNDFSVDADILPFAEMQLDNTVYSPELIIQESAIWVSEGLMHTEDVNYFLPPPIIIKAGTYNLQLIGNPMLLVSLRFY
jgi:hypothetical protein